MGLAALAGLGASIVYVPRAGMTQAVEAFGFRDVTLTGVAWLGCANDDVFRRKWTARRPDGEALNGVVCGGLSKGWTVRITSPRRQDS